MKQYSMQELINGVEMPAEVRMSVSMQHFTHLSDTVGIFVREVCRSLKINELTRYM